MLPGTVYLYEIISWNNRDNIYNSEKFHMDLYFKYYKTKKPKLGMEICFKPLSKPIKNYYIKNKLMIHYLKNYFKNNILVHREVVARKFLKLFQYIKSRAQDPIKDLDYTIMKLEFQCKDDMHINLSDHIFILRNFISLENVQFPKNNVDINFKLNHNLSFELNVSNIYFQEQTYDFMYIKRNRLVKIYKEEVEEISRQDKILKQNTIERIKIINKYHKFSRDVNILFQSLKKLYDSLMNLLDNYEYLYLNTIKLIRETNPSNLEYIKFERKPLEMNYVLDHLDSIFKTHSDT